MKHALIILLASGLAVSAQVQYAFTNFAGIPSGPWVDGTGGAARFQRPSGVAADTADNVYVADTDNHTIRKITPGGVVTTVAGMAGQAGSSDGTGSAARFSSPRGVAVDNAGNVYVADSINSTIRKITPAGAVTTLAGSAGQVGSTNGTSSAARFRFPYGVAVDSAGNLYVADTGNNTIRKITPAGVVSTLAGSAGQNGSTDGNGIAARFYFPSGVAVDRGGNVYVADANNRTIRKITTGIVTTLAGSAGQGGSADGTGSAARFGDPFGVALDKAGNIYVADNATIRKITPDRNVTTLAGSPGNFGSADGTGSAARFNSPEGLAVDSDANVYVADTYNHAIRKITPAGEVTTFAGSAEQPGSADGTGSAARFTFPNSVAVDGAGNLYVADLYDNTIRKVTPGAVVTTLAGSAGQSGSDDGTASAARFNQPYAVAVDSAGNVYVADGGNETIRKITPAGEVTTLAGSAGQGGSDNGTGSAARFGGPTGVAVDSAGYVYVAEWSNQTIRKITPAGEVTTLAGSTRLEGSDDGGGSAARFSHPYGLAVDSAGNVYVGDSHNQTIRKITPAGMVTTLAGSAGQIGSNDGIGSAARFGSAGPAGMAVDSADNVYVADSGNNTIRMITRDGGVTTLAGSPGQTGSADGIGNAARFGKPGLFGPGSAAVDSAGNLYVADRFNYRITKGTPLFRFQSSAGSSTISNGLFQILLTGPFGTNVVLESSANFQSWMPIQTNALTPDGLAVSLPLNTNQNQFFRARLTP